MDMTHSELPRISELAKIVDKDCPICHGEGWVCENHPETAWGDGNKCCGGAGMPCKCSALHGES